MFKFLRLDQKYKIPISCLLKDVDLIIKFFENFHLMFFLEDIDPIFKMFKNFQDGSSGFPARVFSKHYTSFAFQCYTISEPGDSALAFCFVIPVG